MFSVFWTRRRVSSTTSSPSAATFHRGDQEGAVEIGGNNHRSGFGIRLGRQSTGTCRRVHQNLQSRRGRPAAARVANANLGGKVRRRGQDLQRRVCAMTKPHSGGADEKSDQPQG